MRKEVRVKKVKVTTIDALDRIVMQMVQQFENVHPRIQATCHVDEDCGDEFITLYDPLTDQCLTVWMSQAWYGNKVLGLAKEVMSSNLKR